MKKYRCYSDIGSVLVGNEELRVALPNIGGDGYTKLEVYEQEECPNLNSKYDFITCMTGKFNVYEYDCAKGDEKPLLTLEGRYGIYRGKMTVALEKWGDI